jgi:multiple sugar transport system substrate-binding protein
VNPNAVNVQSYGFTIGYVDALAQFSKQNPTIQTQLTTGPFPAKFLTLAAAGTPPDVLFVPSGGSVLSYASQQLLLPLDQYVQTAKISSADFYTPAWNENLYSGKVYAITNEVDPNFALVYNKALFQQLGIAKPPATTQELDDANAKFYQSQGGVIKRLGILPPWLTYGTGNSLLTWFAVFGGGSLDPSDPKKLNVLQPADVTTMTWMKQYADHFGGYDSITKFIQSWGPSLIYKGYVSAFVNGQVAMGPMVSANYKSLLDAAKGGTYDGQFALALMPAGPNVKPDPSWLGGWGLGIPNGSKKVDQAWQVLAWMNASPDGTDLWASLNNFLPGYKKSAFYGKNASNPLVTGYQDVLAGAHLVPPALGSAPGDPAGDLLNAVVQGKSDVNTALTQYQQVVSAAYSKINYQVPGAF